MTTPPRRPREYWPEWRRLGLFKGLTLADELRERAARFPEARLTWISRQRPATATLQELQAESLKVAAGLATLGMKPGDRVVAQLPSWKETAVLEAAAWMLGLVWVPVVHIYGPAELGFILRESKAKLLATPARWNGIDYAARYTAIGDLPDLEHVLVIGDGSMPGQAMHWQDMLGRAAPLPALPAIDPDSVCLMIFTSGTTAAPKGVQHTHHTFGAEMRGMTAHASVRERCRALSAFPGGHVAGLLETLRARFHGMDSWVLDTWDAQAAADLVVEHRIQVSAGTPFHLTSMLAAAGSRRLPALSSYLMGSTSIPASLIEEAQALGIGGYRCYGSSEHPTITSGFPDEPLDKRAGSDGRLLPHNRARLVDDEGRAVPDGEPGEIVSLAPELMVGYLREEENIDAFADDGWYRTGDIAVRDAEGYIAIVDRKKDIINRGGEKFASKEIEDHLMTHPDVLEAAAVGWPDATLGERVAVFLRTRSGKELGLVEVQAHFKSGGLSGRKTPERILMRTDLPRNPAGKLLKKELRNEAKRLAAAESPRS